MILLSLQRALFLFLVLLSVSFANCSSTEPKSGESANDAATDPTKNDVNQKRVENIDPSAFEDTEEEEEEDEYELEDEDFEEEEEDEDDED